MNLLRALYQKEMIDGLRDRRSLFSSFFFPLLGVVRTLLPTFLSILLLPLFMCTHPILRPKPQSEVTFRTLNRSPSEGLFEWHLEGSLKLLAFHMILMRGRSVR